MRIGYHPETDSLYVHFNDNCTDASEEVAEGTVLHFDAFGSVTGIEFYSGASDKVDGVPSIFDENGVDVEADDYEVIEAQRKGQPGKHYIFVPNRDSGGGGMP